MMDAQIKPTKEEYAKSMGQRGNDAAWKDVKMESSTVECASGMGQRSKNRALKVAAYEEELSVGRRHSPSI
jgi:hypothetical protein